MTKDSTNNSNSNHAWIYPGAAFITNSSTSCIAIQSQISGRRAVSQRISKPAVARSNRKSFHSKLWRMNQANSLSSSSSSSSSSSPSSSDESTSLIQTPSTNATNKPKLDSTAVSPSTKPASLPQFLNACYRFTRPHTMIGSASSVISVSMLSLRAFWQVYASKIPSATIASSNWMNAVFHVTALSCFCALLVNVYIVGLNQMYDVELDKINKPNLPLASGDLTMKQGWGLTLGALLTCMAILCLFALGTTQGLASNGIFQALSKWTGMPLSNLVSKELVFTLLGSVLLGTVYSLPPVRLKRFPLAASICILSVRGVIVNWGFFMSMQRILLATFGLIPSMNATSWLPIPPVLWFSILFFMVFGIIIAFLKDIPDIIGDKKYNYNSFAVRLGAKRIFNVSVGILCMLYAASAGFLACGAFAASAAISWTNPLLIAMMFYHLAVPVYLIWRSRKVEPENSKSVTKFYMDIWKLFYLEYIALPFLVL